MNALTKKYRQIQFDKISTEYSEYKTKIKIIKPNGSTNWIDIEVDEFEKIKNILLENVKPKHTPREIVEQCKMRWEISLEGLTENDFEAEELEQWIAAANCILDEFNLERVE